LVDEFMSRDFSVTVLDNLSGGSLENIRNWLENQSLKFAKVDLFNLEDVMRALEECKVVFHLAANPEVRIGVTDPGVHYRQNIYATFNVLEAARNADIETLVFTSSSSVYGEVTKIPTPEDYSPMKPISVYGASKLSCEALIVAYAQTYGFKALIYRLANIVGSRSIHGVVHDFTRKLRKDPRELEILGDGTQTKSYLHVEDCISAMLLGLENIEAPIEIFNVGSEDQIDVKTIAKIVFEEMGLENVRVRFTGGVNGGRGWVGDVRNMLLETSRLKSRGWKPRHNSEQSIRLAVREMLSKGK
jgi:UDP-glucose 4-epimerase